MSISRADVIARAQTLWGGLQTTEYDQGSYRNGYRTDCSGFVCGCWGISTNYNTVSLVTDGVMFEIDLNDLQPGDAAGNCGPGTAGDDGHIVLFDRWYNDDPNDSRYWIYEQAGGGSGPLHRVIDWPYPGEDNWRAYRYTGITDSTGGADVPTDAQWNAFIVEWEDFRNKCSTDDHKSPFNALVATINRTAGLEQAVAKLQAVSVDAIVAALKPLFAQSQPVSQDELEAALRDVLGSLDNKTS